MTLQASARSSGAVNPATGDLLDGDSHPMLAGAGRPGVQRSATERLQLAFVGDLVRTSFDDHTPSGVVERTAVVHLKDDWSTGTDRAELGSRLGAEDDGVIVGKIVDRKDQRLPVRHK